MPKNRFRYGEVVEAIAWAIVRGSELGPPQAQDMMEVMMRKKWKGGGGYQDVGDVGGGVFLFGIVECKGGKEKEKDFWGGRKTHRPWGWVTKAMAIPKQQPVGNFALDRAFIEVSVFACLLHR